MTRYHPPNAPEPALRADLAQLGHAGATLTIPHAGHRGESQANAPEVQKANPKDRTKGTTEKYY